MLTYKRLMLEPMNAVLHNRLPKPSEILPLPADPAPAPVQQIPFQFLLQARLGASIEGLDWPRSSSEHTEQCLNLN